MITNDSDYHEQFELKTNGEFSEIINSIQERFPTVDMNTQQIQRLDESRNRFMDFDKEYFNSNKEVLVSSSSNVFRIIRRTDFSPSDTSEEDELSISDLTIADDKSGEEPVELMKVHKPMCTDSSQTSPVRLNLRSYQSKASSMSLDVSGDDRYQQIVQPTTASSLSLSALDDSFSSRPNKLATTTKRRSVPQLFSRISFRFLNLQRLFRRRSTSVSDFYQACCNNQVTKVERYLEILSLCDIDKLQPDGSTALHIAASFGYQQIVRLLLQAGASPTILSKHGLTPADLAKTEEIKQLFHRRSTLVTSRSTPYELIAL
ncbi:unnamed protein product, partial [Didymodactylos carnosus]